MYEVYKDVGRGPVLIGVTGNAVYAVKIAKESLDREEGLGAAWVQKNGQQVARYETVVEYPGYYKIARLD